MRFDLLVCIMGGKPVVHAYVDNKDEAISRYEEAKKDFLAISDTSNLEANDGVYFFPRAEPGKRHIYRPQLPDVRLQGKEIAPEPSKAALKAELEAKEEELKALRRTARELNKRLTEAKESPVRAPGGEVNMSQETEATSGQDGLPDKAAGGNEQLDDLVRDVAKGLDLPDPTSGPVNKSTATAGPKGSVKKHK